MRSDLVRTLHKNETQHLKSTTEGINHKWMMYVWPYFSEVRPWQLHICLSHKDSQSNIGHWESSIELSDRIDFANFTKLLRMNSMHRATANTATWRGPVVVRLLIQEGMEQDARSNNSSIMGEIVLIEKLRQPNKQAEARSTVAQFMREYKAKRLKERKSKFKRHKRRRTILNESRTHTRWRVESCGLAELRTCRLADLQTCGLAEAG